MPRARSGFSRGRSAPRRRIGWEEGPGGNAIQAITASSTVILGSGSAALVDGVILVRVRGAFQAFLSVADAVGSGYHGAFGLAVVDNAAFAIGVTAMPEPVTDMQENVWLYHQFFDIHNPTVTLDEGSSAAAVRLEVDGKAMRKLAVGDTIAAILQVFESTNAEMRVFFDSRMLIKLA